MLFKTSNFKQFLSSINKNKIKNISIKSTSLKLTINTAKRKNLTKHKVKHKNTDQNNLAENKKTNTVTSKQKRQTKVNREQETYFTIISPMIGTFYRSPAPNEAPFIEINDLVKTSQTVCIIEAMKLMNEIESEVNGSIVEILVRDGDVVDCGQALMRVKQKNK